MLRKKGDKLEGKVGATFDAMGKIMNFSYKLVPTIDGLMGSQVRTYEVKSPISNLKIHVPPRVYKS